MRDSNYSIILWETVNQCFAGYVLLSYVCMYVYRTTFHADYEYCHCFNIQIYRPVCWKMGWFYLQSLCLTNGIVYKISVNTEWCVFWQTHTILFKSPLWQLIHVSMLCMYMLEWVSVKVCVLEWLSAQVCLSKYWKKTHSVVVRLHLPFIYSG